MLQVDEETSMLSDLMRQLVSRLQQSLPEFSQHLGYDGKFIASDSSGRVKPATKRNSDESADLGYMNVLQKIPHGVRSSDFEVCLDSSCI